MGSESSCSVPFILVYLHNRAHAPACCCEDSGASILVVLLKCARSSGVRAPICICSDKIFENYKEARKGSVGTCFCLLAR